MEELKQETQETQETKITAAKKVFRKPKAKAILLIIAAVLLLGCLLGNCCRKYDYAVMCSENAVATLNEVKQGGWEIINARWAADARGVWNYELIVRRKAPLFGIFGKKMPKSAPAQQMRQPAPKPAPQPAPAPEAQPEAPKK
ncbi:MAG: hypothetical protein KBS54_04870 [Synergistaceae bacterium]|nr:hypothetical protein [Candidatus Equadaptatus faecalis]